MKIIFILLSFFSIQYGLIFSPVQSKVIKLFGRLLFLNQLLLEVYYGFKRAEGNFSFIDWVGHEAYYISSVIYGFVIMKKGQLIVDNIRSNIYLLNSIQYKVACSIVIIFSIIYMINFSIFFKDTFFDHNFAILSAQSWKSIVFVISTPYIYWKFFSGITYSLMYFQMYLKHIKLLDHIKQKKNHSHIIVFKILTQIQTDYKNFDNLVSIFPALWLTSFFLGVNANVTYVKTFGFTVMFITGFTTNIISWLSIYVLVNVCKSVFVEKIKLIQYHIVVNELLNDEKILKLRFLDQMSENHVTAFHLLKFDKGLFLPYVGSVLSYTFLFYDKFKQS